ncbi:NADH-dependent flavin oxidoreductase-like protein [Lindgomyces ingoldianus]|uniref:NADH-dependent flavin oxidoreductase-like protein n=1 Tax=Lindgomyces ingoldianus TaxID=673940 RepID=A0ACB6Q8I8_9PLEO|nr:NADH-dependent flavin oxidoreductase-like protein [Lindgomyces ingoldianus]KAF2463234.1 NADH-dependent flavin oxidoreductase-like protein [Lindgomyces ingoldianus]
MAPPNLNIGVPNLPYFTPQHAISPGTPFPSTTSKSTPIPTLFTPLQIRSITLRNRIIVAPMCQYSTACTGPETGALTNYHIATLGHYALKGAGLVFIEATGVQPHGRISPNCPGLWDDAQIAALKRVADFVKSQGSVCGIQLAHAGRKASTVAPWVAARGGDGMKKVSVRATKEVGGWPGDVVGPMGGEGEAWDGKSESDENGGFWAPRALTEKEIDALVGDFASAARRAVKAGVQVVEIHAAHGYLLHQFLSPVTNRRTDRYGGSFENRIRLLVEVMQAVRNAMPSELPLFLRISSTEWLEGSELGKQYGSWDVESSLILAKMLPALGVDLLDVSSGGNSPMQSINMYESKDYQTRIAARIRGEMKKEGLNLLIGAVGLITEAEQARDIVEEGGAVGQAGENGSIDLEAKVAVEMTEGKGGRDPMADVILVARQFMREPEWVLKVAWKLGVDIAWPSQFLRVRFPKL